MVGPQTTWVGLSYPRSSGTHYPNRRSTLTSDLRQGAHDVRHFRNYWVHEDDAVPAPMTVDQARAQLQIYLHELPDEWG